MMENCFFYETCDLAKANNEICLISFVSEWYMWLKKGIMTKIFKNWLVGKKRTIKNISKMVVLGLSHFIPY